MLDFTQRTLNFLSLSFSLFFATLLEHNVRYIPHLESPLFSFRSKLIQYSYRNSTALASPTYWGQFEEIGQFNPTLNVAERLWAAWYAWMQNDVLATGIMSFVMHEAVYFGRSLPWIFIDSLGLFKKYKIQNVSRETEKPRNHNAYEKLSLIPCS